MTTTPDNSAPPDSPSETSASSEPPDSPDPSLRRIAVETLVFTVACVGGVFLAGYLFRSPLEEAARWMIDVLGYGGMFAGVFAADAFTFPLPPDVYLFLSIASGADVLATIAVCSISSVIAGNLAYKIGPYIERIPLLRERLDEFRPRGEYLFQEWGGWAVAISALTPVPFSIVSWLAGIYRMSHRSFFLASLFRIPRIAGYYALYAYGWAPSVL